MKEDKLVLYFVCGYFFFSSGPEFLYVKCTIPYYLFYFPSFPWLLIPVIFSPFLNKL